MGKKKSAAKKRQTSEGVPPPSSGPTVTSASMSNGHLNRFPSFQISQKVSVIDDDRRSASGSGSSSPYPPPTPLEDPPSPSPVPEVVQLPEDVGKRAETLKVLGNDAFKAAKYSEAVELYTKAIGLWPYYLLSFTFSLGRYQIL